MTAAAADVDAADGGSAGGHVPRAARACGRRDAAARVWIGAASGVGLSSAGPVAVHAAARTVAVADAGAAAGAAQAGFISAGGRHRERSGAAAAG